MLAYLCRKFSFLCEIYSNIFPRTDNISCLLESWFSLYDLLLELHHDLAMKKAYYVFDAFMDNPCCREKIMARINMGNFEKDQFQVEHLLEVIFHQLSSSDGVNYLTIPFDSI